MSTTRLKEALRSAASKCSGGVFRVGVVGFSGAPFDKEKGRRAIVAAFDAVAESFSPRPLSVEIVSGLTLMGVPQLAYEEAARRG